MQGEKRADIKPGLSVRVVKKEDQRTGRLTEGVVRDIQNLHFFKARFLKHFNSSLSAPHHSQPPPAIHQTYDLENAAQAHRAMEETNFFGKLLLLP